MSEVEMSDDGRRLVLLPPIQCFEGKTNGVGAWQGELVGTTRDYETMHAFLAGDEVELDEL